VTLLNFRKLNNSFPLTLLHFHFRGGEKRTLLSLLTCWWVSFHRHETGKDSPSRTYRIHPSLVSILFPNWGYAQFQISSFLYKFSFEHFHFLLLCHRLMNTWWKLVTGSKWTEKIIRLQQGTWVFDIKISWLAYRENIVGSMKIFQHLVNAGKQIENFVGREVINSGSILKVNKVSPYSLITYWVNSIMWNFHKLFFIPEFSSLCVTLWRH